MGLKTIADDLEKWYAANPLELWFRANMGALDDRKILAGKLRVSRQSLWNWIKGRSLPRSYAFRLIERVAGVTKRQWLDWWNSRPRPWSEP